MVFRNISAFAGAAWASSKQSLVGNGRLAALATALAIIMVTYPGVLFFGHSIQASHIIEEFSINPGQSEAKPYWEPRGRRADEGYHDLGGAAWQMEPMLFFMRNCIWGGESPYWNPYSACGSLGPETVIDAKFSLFTLAVALAGASSLSFHLILFATHLVALYCLHRLLAGPFALGRCASFVGCAVFYLGGARLAFASSQVSLALIMAPVLLYPLVAFMQNPRWSWFVMSIAGSAAVQLTQFVPCIIVVHLVACALVVGFFLELGNRWSRPVWIRLALAFSTFPLGVLLCAPLWFPFVASLAQTTLSTEYYGRMTSNVPAAALFSLFSPQHLWESYSGFSRSGGLVLFPKGGSLAAGVFHWGIVTTVLAAAGFGAKKLRRRPLFWSLASLLLFVHCMEWHWPFISPLAELPVLRSVRYWNTGSFILVALLAAFGLENLNRRNCASWPAIGGFALLGGTFFLAWRVAGGIPPGRRVECILLLAVTSACALFLLAGRLAERSLPWIRVFFPVLLLAELVNYANHLQPPRNNVEKTPPAWVAFLKRNLDGARFINFGRRTVYPEWGTAFQMEQADSMNGSKLRWMQTLWGNRMAKKNAFFHVVPAVGKAEFKMDRSALDLLGVKFVVASGTEISALLWLQQNGFTQVPVEQGRHIYQNPQFSPRAFVVPEVFLSEKLPSEIGGDARTVATTSDPRFVELAMAAGVPVWKPASTSSPAPLDGPNPEVRIVKRHNTEVKIDVRLSNPGVVVLTETWHPNWSVFVNGKKQALGRVNIAFRGVALSAGDYEITYHYDPPLLKVACATSIFIIVVLLGVGRKWDTVRRLLMPPPV